MGDPCASSVNLIGTSASVDAGWSVSGKCGLLGYVVLGDFRREGSTSAFRNRIVCPDEAGHRDVTSCKTREV